MKACQTPGCRVAVLRQRGQAMVLVAMFLVVLMLSVLVLFNTSQITRDKIKVQNAADAVAYSAAILEARHLNFVAYTNRAMIANEVAIGQTIGLVTWIQKWGVTFKFGSNLAKSLSGIPIAGPIISAALQTFFEVLSNAMNKFADGMAKFADIFGKLVSGFNTFLGYSQVAFRIGTYESILVMSGSLQQGMKDMNIPTFIIDTLMHGEKGLIERNAPGARMGTVSQFMQFMNLFLFEKFNKGCKPADALGPSATVAELNENHACMKQMAAAVNDSRDLWSRNRENQKLRTPNLHAVINIPLLGKFGIDNFSIGLFQGGGSALRYISGAGGRGSFNWSSMDASDFGFELGIYLFDALIQVNPKIPAGWGTMQMAHKDKKNKEYKLADLPSGGDALLTAGWNAAYGNSWSTAPTASFMASFGFAPPPLWGSGNKTARQGSYGDLSPFHTIDPDYASHQFGSYTVNLKMLAPPPFVVWVYMPETETHTSDNMGSGATKHGPKGRFALDNKAAGLPQLGAFGQNPGIQAIAGASVYYHRFDYSLDEQEDEEANAFSPYWNARLTKVDPLMLTAALASQSPALAWAYSGVQQSATALAGDAKQVAKDQLDDMEDVQKNIPDIAKQVVKDAISGMFSWP